MYSIPSVKNSFKKNAEQIILSLCKYKNLIGTSRNQRNCLQAQIQFHSKLISNQKNKINMELLKIYDYLQENQENQIKNIMEEFATLLNQIEEFLQKTNSNAKGVISKIDSTLVCFNCKNSLEEARIAKIKENIGMTSCTVERTLNEQDPRKKQRSVKQYLKSDDYEQKQKHHIFKLQTHITSLMKVIQKQYQSKTVKILGKQNEVVKKNELQLKKQSSIVKQNERQFIETQKYYEKFNERFIEFIKKPIQQTVVKLLNFIIQQKKLKANVNFSSIETQTLIAPQNQIQQCMQSKLVEQQLQIKRLWTFKKERDQDVLKYLQNQFKIKKDINKMQQDKINLQEKLKQCHQKINIVQNKAHVQIVLKCKEINKLEKQISELKQKLMDKEKLIKNQTISSKKIIPSSIRVANKILSKKEIQKDSKQNLQSKHIIDFTIEEQEKQNKTYPRFQNQKKRASKYINAIRNIKNHQFEKPQFKATVHFKDSTPISQMVSKSQINYQKKSNHFLLTRQLYIMIQPYVTEPLPIKQLNNKVFAEKKTKSLKFLSTQRKEQKQNNITNLNSSPKTPKGEREKKSLHKTVPSLIKETEKRKNEQHQNLADSQKKIKLLSNPRTVRQRQKTQKLEKGQEDNEKTANTGRRAKSRNNAPTTHESSSKHLLPQIKFKYIELFGGEHHAFQFESYTGVWPYLCTVDKLVVDYENSNFANQVQQYFNRMHQNEDPKLAQYLSFLTRPATYFEAKKRNQQQLYEKPTDSSVSIIKTQFIQLARFHKLVHRTCNHVWDFLESIGFFLH